LRAAAWRTALAPFSPTAQQARPQLQATAEEKTRARMPTAAFHGPNCEVSTTQNDHRTNEDTRYSLQ
jgi:hypothetical protein